MGIHNTITLFEILFGIEAKTYIVNSVWMFEKGLNWTGIYVSKLPENGEAPLIYAMFHCENFYWYINVTIGCSACLLCPFAVCVIYLLIHLLPDTTNDNVSITYS